MDHPADQAVGVQHRHLGAHPVGAPHVELDGLLETWSTAPSYHLGGQDLVAAGARDTEQLAQFLRSPPVEALRRQVALEPLVLRA